MKTRIFKTLFPFAAAACVCSCVNEEYDLEKIQLDEFHVLDNACAPLGSTKKFMLSDLFSDLGADKYLKTDKNGNYYVEFVGDRVSTEIEVPSFKFDGYSDAKPQKTQLGSPINFPQLKPGVVINPAIVTDPVAFEDVTFKFELSQTNLPEEIKAVRYADVDSQLIIKVGYESSSVPFSKIWMSKGAQLTFPEWIVLGDAPEGFAKTDDHTLVSTDNFDITPSNTEICIPLDGLDFSKMPEGQGIVGPGKLYLDAEVEFAGSVYLTSDEYTSSGVGPFSPTLVTYLNMDPMTIQSVEATLDLAELGYTEFEATIGDVTETLGDLDAVLDLSALRLNVGVSSTFPSAINLSSNIITSDKTFDLGTIQIPEGSATAPGSAYYSISEDGTGAPENYQNLSVADWNSLLSPIPDALKFTVLPSLGADEYMTITPGATYELGLDYSFSSSAFGPDFRIGLNQTFDGMGVNLGVAEVPWAILTLNAVNTIPVNMSVAAKAIDSEGNILDTITADVSSDIMGGALDNPAVTPITLHLRTSGPVEFDGLILTFTASSISGNTVLNSAQYLQLTDMALSLPSGATIKYDKLEE